MDMDMENYLRFLLALVFVLGLLLALALILKRFVAPGAATPRGARRLKVLETLAVDPKRRLLLVRRDGVDHLLLIGGTGGDLVVETAIPAPEKTEDETSGARTPFARLLKTAARDGGAERRDPIPPPIPPSATPETPVPSPEDDKTPPLQAGGSTP